MKESSESPKKIVNRHLMEFLKGTTPVTFLKEIFKNYY